MSNSPKAISRRVSLQILGGLVAASALPLAACGSSEGGGGGGGGGGSGGGGGGGGPSCSSTVDAQSQQLRSALQYRAESELADRHCSNCAQYQAGAFGDCGGCTLFSGPVQPNGHCLSWAALAAAAPGAAPAAPQ